MNRIGDQPEPVSAFRHLIPLDQSHSRLRIEDISSSALRYSHAQIHIQPNLCDLDPRIILVLTRQKRVIVMVVMSMTMRMPHMRPLLLRSFRHDCC